MLSSHLIYNNNVRDYISIASKQWINAMPSIVCKPIQRN